MTIFFNLIYFIILYSSLELSVKASSSLTGLAGKEDVSVLVCSRSSTLTHLTRDEALIQGGDQEAIKRKFYGLLQGGSIRLEERSVYDFLSKWPPVERERTADYYPTYGYERNSEAAREFNDTLVERDDQEAIKRKLDGLIRGGDMPSLKEWEGALRGPPGSCVSAYGIYCNRYWHPYPTYGYKKNPTAAEEFKVLITIKPALLGILKTHIENEDLLKIILRYMC